MIPAIKCRHCGRFIVRNDAGEWVLPHAKFPSPQCLDGIHTHEPGKDPNGRGAGIATGIAIGASVAESGLI